MKSLNVMEMPLNTAALIEASAGTGKTYTMANLYLRLLLGVGCEPLTVEQILVVTFTKAATAELRDRIRANIQQCHAFFKAHYAHGTPPSDKEQYYFELYQATQSAYEAAVLRLRIAEREMDLASVYTIHGFCQKMLTEFAFESGMRFDFDLQSDETLLLKKLSENVWREQFYPLSMAQTKAVSAHLQTPEAALKLVRSHLSKPLPPLPENVEKGVQNWQSGEFAKQSEKYTAFIARVKSYWQAHFEEIVAPIKADLDKANRSLNGNKYQKEPTKKRIEQMKHWCFNTFDEQFPADDFMRFCEEYLKAGGIKKDCEFDITDHFVKNQGFLTAYLTEFAEMMQLQRSVLQVIFLQALREKVAQYKALHSDKGFEDLLHLLNQALKAPQGQRLAAEIRAKFPFAMIDEFQDTDLTQYEIFSQIFMAQGLENQGFIMIGDPKQSIYKFRGADIFTYLKAANQAQEKRTLGVNWRSIQPIVAGVNQLFAMPEEVSPFLYDGIHFQSVQAKIERAEAVAKGEVEPAITGQSPLNSYLQPNQVWVEKEDKKKGTITELKTQPFNVKLAAEQCAHQIQQQLKKMEAGEFGTQIANQPESFQPFRAPDIAILVRSRKEAALMKQALAKRQIKSVFMSERSSVYQTDTAQDLIWILRACLSPYHQNSVLAALGCTLWGLTAAEIFTLKQSETEWDSTVERFVHYQQIWQQEGILPMLHQLYLNEGLIERLRGQADADRTITDLLHLTELLQAQQPMAENEAALVRWYEHQVFDNTNQEAYALRLESEEQLIKIITIHSSKGLQYPIVWLPFVGNKNKGEQSNSMTIYQDDKAQSLWDFGSKSSEITALKDKAEFSEDLRLLYVALTRAEFQLNLILPEVFPKGWNAMLYLLTNGEVGLNKAMEISTATKTLLEQKAAGFSVTTLPEEEQFDDWVAQTATQAVRIPLYFTKEIPQDGQVTSFTALHSYHEWQAENRPLNSDTLTTLQDYDAQAETDVEVSLLEEAEESQGQFSPYQFPHSTKVGTLLHRFFELQDFQQPISATSLQPLLQGLSLGEEWLEPLQHWFEAVKTTTFGQEQVSLAMIPPEKRLNEWAFYLRLKKPEGLRTLNRLLQQHHPLAKNLPELMLPQLEGYIRGFVDCIAQINGRFYLIDYKSNFLGYWAEDYQAHKIEKTMGQYRYDLQYLLYTLALHRYLRTRLGDHYDYERDFGGVAYLFLRGMNATPDRGVYFDKPSLELIEGMDGLFG